ncbi:electron transport complex subunit RsxG [Brumicola blandensis]|uniref:Ion-translocating oxidoreductase complex subunit G n=1 Tax=Brumicola blandensis TaxID=3075611 RepID=A0AAW8R0L2_9ALTE|nr:electron transport complex subunit RsxG [Alteromonas sp. W409]MDT0582963.1 electron transport complex subunit RsxG [Alteromonas sp. W409]
MIMNYMGKNGLILGAFALVTTGLIALTFNGTETRIKAAEEKQLLSVLNELVPESQHTNELHLDCIVIKDSLLGSSESKRIFRARNESNNVAAVLEATAPNGYSGEIKLVVAADINGDSLGARVIKHEETPGLGDKIDIRVSDWILSFNDVPFDGEADNRWQVKKDGGQFDQFTGATITPRAVVEAVKNALLYFNQNQALIFNTPSNCNATNEPEVLIDE